MLSWLLSKGVFWYIFVYSHDFLDPVCPVNNTTAFSLQQSLPVLPTQGWFWHHKRFLCTDVSCSSITITAPLFRPSTIFELLFYGTHRFFWLWSESLVWHTVFTHLKRNLSTKRTSCPRWCRRFHFLSLSFPLIIVIFFTVSLFAPLTSYL